MIGNDIIDLCSSTLGNSQRQQRYLDKIATQAEQSLIKALGSEDRWIWLLWSIKESVYKIIVRREKKIRFAPKSIVIKAISSEGGFYLASVEYQDLRFDTSSELTKSYIHTIASDLTISIVDIYSEIIEIDNSQNSSEQIRQSIITYIQSILKAPETDYRIITDDLRIPRLYIDGEEKGWISISHDGGYGAFVSEAIYKKYQTGF